MDHLRANKTLLVTGTTSGIGEAIAQLFLKKGGWNIIATARSPEKIAGWSHSDRVTKLALDVTDERSVEAAIDETVGRFGRIDVVVNSAGFGLAGPLEAIPQPDLEAQFATNVFGPARVARICLPHMRKARTGTIVNVSSILGRFGLPFRVPYCASKYAMEGMMEALSYEVRPFGIRVKLVEPGGIRTAFKTKWIDHPAYEALLKIAKAAEEKAIVSSPGPEIVAEAVFRAATDGSNCLRYPVAANPYLALHRFLPGALWQTMLQASVGKIA